MNILYLTTALDDADYNRLFHHCPQLPNPSNQNFHYRLIQALNSINKISLFVLSMVNVTSDEYTLFEDHDIYHYLNYPKNPILAFPGRSVQLTRMGLSLSEEKGNIILYDALNLKLTKAALSLRKRLGCKAIAILTDNPNNFAKPTPFYAKQVLALSAQADGCLALTKGLIKTFGLAKRPFFVFDGVVESPKTKRLVYPQGSYLYYAGSLLPKYGITDLLDAYQETQPFYDLLIAGHHEDKKLLDPYLSKNSRIHFLGQLPKDENLAYEGQAALLVNPRPNDSKLDEESIPSKLLEYLASGSPILSTKHPLFAKQFPNDVNWLAESGAASLRDFFRAHLDNNQRFVNLKENNAAEGLLKTNGIPALGKALYAFLTSLS